MSFWLCFHISSRGQNYAANKMMQKQVKRVRTEVWKEN